MKANEAPEKLYIDSREHWRKSWTAFTTKAKGNDIEYTRTDAFIEKATKWVKERAELFLLKTPMCDYYDYKKAVVDFKKYIEE